MYFEKNPKILPALFAGNAAVCVAASVAVPKPFAAHVVVPVCRRVSVSAFTIAASAVLRAAAQARFPVVRASRRAEAAALMSLAARFSADEESWVGICSVDHVVAFGSNLLVSHLVERRAIAARFE